MAKKTAATKTELPEVHPDALNEARHLVQSRHDAAHPEHLLARIIQLEKGLSAKPKTKAKTEKVEASTETK